MKGHVLDGTKVEELESDDSSDDGLQVRQHQNSLANYGD